MKKLLSLLLLTALAGFGAPLAVVKEPYTNAVLGQLSYREPAFTTFTARGTSTTVDLALAGNLFSLTTDITLTYSNSTPQADTAVLLRFEPGSSTRAVTIPTTWNLASGANITSLTITANTPRVLQLQYASATSRFEIFDIVGGGGGSGGTPAGVTGDLQTNSSGVFGALTPGAGVATWLATPTSANLATAVTNETGSGALVFATSPTFATSLFTPAVISTSADPADAGLLRLGNTDLIEWEANPTGTDITLGVNSSNQFVFSNPLLSPAFIAPALGTPTSGVATNLTGIATGLTAGNVTTNANLTGPITSTGNATSVAAQTGTGSVFVMQNTPTLVTPAIGAATGTSLVVTGNVTTGSGSGVAGASWSIQGTAPTPQANSIGYYAPASVPTAYGISFPSAPTTGFVYRTGTGTPQAETIVTGPQAAQNIGLAFYPETYGAVGDGVADDTTACQAAIAAASAAYGTVYFGQNASKVYSVTGLTLANHMSIDGSGTLAKRGAGGTVPTNCILRTVDALVGGTTYYGNFDNITIKNISIDGRTGSGNASLLYAIWTRNLTVQNVTVLGYWSGQFAMALGGQNLKISKVSIFGGTALFQDGIHILHGYGSISDSRIESGDDMISLGADQTIASLAAQPEGVSAMAITNITGSSAWANALKVYSENSAVAAFSVANVTANNMVATCGQNQNGAIAIQDSYVSVTAANSRLHDIEVSNCVFNIGSAAHSSTNAQGIRVSGARNLYFKNILNIFTDPSSGAGFNEASFTTANNIVLDIQDNLVPKNGGIFLTTTSNVSITPRMTAGTTVTQPLLKLQDAVGTEVVGGWMLGQVSGVNVWSCIAGTTTTLRGINTVLSHAAGASSGLGFAITAADIARITLSGVDFSGCFSPFTATTLTSVAALNIQNCPGTSASYQTADFAYPSVGGVTRWYNTTDQTNYERAQAFFTGNIFTISTSHGGSDGNSRSIELLTAAGSNLLVRAFASASGVFEFQGLSNSVSNNEFVKFDTYTDTATGGTEVGIDFNWTLNQASGNAANTAFRVSSVETTLGSGAQYLAQFRAGAAGTTDEWHLTNAGATVQAGALSAGGPLTSGTSGSVVGGLVLNNATSGTITISPTTGALGSTVLVAPAISGTLAITQNSSTVQTVAAGTAYTLTASNSDVVFGTTSPTVTLTATGVYLITATIQTSLVGASYSSAQQVSYNFRRQNNTAADLPGTTFSDPLTNVAITTVTDAGPVTTICSQFSTANTNDVIGLRGVLSATPSLGSITCSNVTLSAVWLHP